MFVDILAFVVLVPFGFYAVKLVSTFKTGMLASSWKLVTIGAVLMVCGQFPLLADTFVSSGSFYVLASAQLLRFAGVAFLALGFRAQCKVWRPPRPKVTNTIQV